MRPYLAQLVALGLRRLYRWRRSRPRLIANLDGYSEGIVFDHQGVAYVSALHRDAVLDGPNGQAVRLLRNGDRELLP